MASKTGIIAAVIGLIFAGVIVLWSFDPGHPLLVRKVEGTIRAKRFRKDIGINVSSSTGQIRLTIQPARRTRAEQAADREHGVEVDKTPITVSFKNDPGWFVATQENKLYYGVVDAWIKDVPIDKPGEEAVATPEEAKRIFEAVRKK